MLPWTQRNVPRPLLDLLTGGIKQARTNNEEIKPRAICLCVWSGMKSTLYSLSTVYTLITGWPGADVCTKEKRDLVTEEQVAFGKREQRITHLLGKETKPLRKSKET